MPTANPVLKQIIAEGYAAGIPTATIARMAGTSSDSVRTLASRMGLEHPMKPANRPAEKIKPRMSPQYQAWLRAKEGAAETLRGQVQ